MVMLFSTISVYYNLSTKLREFIDMLFNYNDLLLPTSLIKISLYLYRILSTVIIFSLRDLRYYYNPGMGKM